ncbi:hypothetical protein [Paracidovorax oryzae]|uniref:hypothetical protein n=1 Tax=Paracidovorax oryzae TaxID=862720 RepID=UPI0012EBEBE0|nr:hypothetical protein [Paracidovorax oryzae]
MSQSDFPRNIDVATPEDPNFWSKSFIDPASLSVAKIICQSFSADAFFSNRR